MKKALRVAVALLLCLVMQFSGSLAAEPEHGLEFCFAPGTRPEVVEQAYARRIPGPSNHSLADGQEPMHQLGGRWSSTATDGGGLGQGDPTTLTWGVVPDGTAIFGAVGEPSAPSNLRAFLNGIYGAGNWLHVFQQVFDRWGELTGITYVYEPNDDGSSLFSNGGIVGVRPDVRIGGHLIDGNSAILAYNYYPNNGDMVIDTADSFYNNTNNGSIRLRNVLAHEHGHGMGLGHVCPVNQTKLMEPFVSTSFDGPQHDDVLGANRGYGDVAEDDDSQGTAFPLGTLGTGTLVQDLSVDDNSDIDFLGFSMANGSAVDVTVTPIGFQYLEGRQNDNGSCSPGTTFDSLAIHDLALTVRDADGVVLASADVTSAGSAEELSGVVIPGGAGYIEVEGDSTNSVQLYRLEMGTDSLLFEDGFESGNLSAWSGTLQ